MVGLSCRLPIRCAGVAPARGRGILAGTVLAEVADPIPA